MGYEGYEREAAKLREENEKQRQTIMIWCMCKMAKEMEEYEREKE